jgi:hypothetical protein
MIKIALRNAKKTTHKAASSCDAQPGDPTRRPPGIPRWLPTETSVESASRSQSSGSPSRRPPPPRPSASAWVNGQTTHALKSTPGRPQTDPTSASRTSRLSIASKQRHGAATALGVLTLLALSLLASPSAAAESSVAEVSFSRAELEGNLSFQRNPTYWAEVPHGLGSFVWDVRALNLTVKVSQQTFVELGNPSDPSQTLTRIAKGPPEYTEFYFEDAVANGTSRSANSSLRPPEVGATGQILSGNGAFVVTPSKPERDPGTLPRNDPETIDANATWATATDGLVQLVGNFSILVEDSVVTVRNATENQEFDSGNSTQGVGTAPPGSPYPVRDRYEQRVRLDVRDGALTLQSSGRTFFVALPYLAVDGNLTARWYDADGNVRDAGKVTTVSEAAWTTQGSMAFLIRNPVGNGTMLQARIEAGPDIFGLASNSPAIGSEIFVPATGQNPAWIWLPVAFAIPWLALVAMRRYGPGVRIDDVEWALMEPKPRLARRLARRYLRGRRDDPTAVFLYAAALSSSKRFRQVVRRIDPLASRLAPRTRASVAFILADAAGRIGDTVLEARWASEARDDPLLRAAMTKKTAR